MAKTKTELREWISSGFTRVEDVAYVGLGLVLAVSALVLLVIVALSLGQAIMSANLPQKIVRLLDQCLLILMIVEILYTLQVSFREHILVAEPFLIVGLIAAIRRVLILTAEFSKPAEISQAAFHNVMFELGGRPPLDRLKETVGALAAPDRELISNGLHVGRVIDEYKTEFGMGDATLRQHRQLTRAAADALAEKTTDKVAHEGHAGAFKPKSRRPLAARVPRARLRNPSAR